MQKLFLLNLCFILTNGPDINTYLYLGFILDKGKGYSSEIVGTLFLLVAQSVGLADARPSQRMGAGGGYRPA